MGSHTDMDSRSSSIKVEIHHTHHCNGGTIQRHGEYSSIEVAKHHTRITAQDNTNTCIVHFNPVGKGSQSSIKFELHIIAHARKETCIAEFNLIGTESQISLQFAIKHTHITTWGHTQTWIVGRVQSKWLYSTHITVTAARYRDMDSTVQSSYQDSTHHSQGQHKHFDTTVHSSWHGIAEVNQFPITPHSTGPHRHFESNVHWQYSTHITVPAARYRDIYSTVQSRSQSMASSINFTLHITAHGHTET